MEYVHMRSITLLSNNFKPQTFDKKEEEAISEVHVHICIDRIYSN